MMPFTKQHSAYAWVVTCILFLINLTFHNLPLHSSYKIHQPITDYFLRLPYSELLEKRLFRSRANRRLVGRCYDLKSAYKQFAVHGSDRDHLHMAVRSPVGSAIRLIGFNALPFGAIGSVAGFLRVSLAVWFVGLVALDLGWTVFYDDYSVQSREELLNSAAWRVETPPNLFGSDFCKGRKEVHAPQPQVQNA